MQFSYEELTIFMVTLVGALAYWVASGATRADYKAFPTVLGIAMFSMIAGGVYWIIGHSCLNHPILRVIVSLVVVVPAAYAYWIAPSADRKTLHVVLIVGVLAGLAGVVYWMIGCLDFKYPVLRAVISLIVTVPTAYVWRIWGTEQVFPYLQKYRITNTTFGPSRAWDTFQTDPDGRAPNYIRIHLTNGEKLDSDLVCLSERHKRNELGFNPSMITDAEGNAFLVVTKVLSKDGTEQENEPIDKKGTEFTYIPAANITKIQVYVDKPE